MTMIETPGDLIEAPPLAAGASMDLLSDMLSHVRLAGALFMRGEYTAPWAFDSPEPEELRALLAPDAERLIVFHAIRAGSAWITSRGERLELGAGDLIVLPHANRHVLGSPGANVVVPIADVLPPAPWSTVPLCRYGGGGAPTDVACGYLRCRDLLFNSFLRRLPAVFRVRPEGAAAEMLRAAIGYLVEAPGDARDGQVALRARVPELLLVEALRLHARQSALRTGWLAAASDPIVSRALKLLHDDPAAEWSVEALARRAATSRSVLNERFRALLGQSPMYYLTEWRMQLAADLLHTTELEVASIAEQTGYGSDAAFSRAFQRHLGMSPAQWRDKMG